MVVVSPNNNPPPPNNVGSIISPLTDIGSFLTNNWGWILVCAISVGLGIAVYYLYKNNEELYKERDEPGYQDYKQKITACMLNSDPKKVQKRYSWVNLLWFGIPFKMNENSARIHDWNNNLIMYYRGELKTSDGYQIYFGYKSKSWIFFEDRFMLKFPLRVKYIKNLDELEKERVTKRQETIDYKKAKYDTVECGVNTGHLRFLPSEQEWRQLRLRSVGIEKFALWWFTPVFFEETIYKSLDWRKILENSVSDNTFQIMNQRNLQISSTATEEMAKINPNLQYQVKAPQKTATEEKDDSMGV